MLFALLIVTFSFYEEIHRPSIGFLMLPWRAIALQCAGMMTLMGGLAYGRLFEPFERVMVWSTIDAGDRGWRRSYPTGLLLLVLALFSLWAAVIGYTVMAMNDDEWTFSTTLMIGLCALLNIGLVLVLSYTHHSFWYAIFFGGNLVVIASLLGWMIGSMGTQSLD